MDKADITMQVRKWSDGVTHHMKTIALIPAAGSGSRLPGISGSKEMLEVAESPASDPRPILQHLLMRLAESSLHQIVVITSPNKLDILNYLGRVGAEPSNVSVELITNSPSVIHTLSSVAGRFSHDSILMALPDIVFQPGRAITDLQKAWPLCRADLLLGLFPTDRPEKSDIVETHADGGVARIRVKDSSAPNDHAWIMAMWTPEFTRFLAEWLQNMPPENSDPQLGDVFIDAIAAGLTIDTIKFPAGKFLDIGTPDDLHRLQTIGLGGSGNEPEAG
jgi:glucose-1-phosphate thymidylyltransferase